MTEIINIPMVGQYSSTNMPLRNIDKIAEMHCVYAAVHGVMVCVCVCGNNRKQKTNTRSSEETYPMHYFNVSKLNCSIPMCVHGWHGTITVVCVISMQTLR